MRADNINVASSETGSLFQIAFESPYSDWEKLAVIRSHLLNSIVAEGQAICMNVDENNEYIKNCKHNNYKRFNNTPSRLFGSQPLNEISEYFETKSTGIAMDFQEKSSQYALTLKMQKKITTVSLYCNSV